MAQDGFVVRQVDSAGNDATDTANHAVKVNVVAGGAGGGLSQVQVRSTDDTTWVNVGSAGATLPVPVNVVAGAAGGGVAQIQTRSTANTWTDVGFAVGDLYLPVIGQGSTKVIGHVVIDSATIAALTDGSQITQITGTPAVILSTSTASIGHVTVDTLPALILSTSTAAIGNVSLLAGTASIGILGTSTAAIGNITSIVNPVVLGTSTASIGNVALLAGTANVGSVVLATSTAHVAVDTMPNVVLSTSTALIGVVEVTDGTNVMSLSTQGSTIITGLIGNAPMAITGDNRPSWVSDVMEPLSQTLGGRLRVYQNENERLIRSIETQILLEYGDRQYSRDYRTPGFMSDRAYSR